ncbi:hypothetical protein AB205_0176440 [Aquarana catesbeiana]|uniref:Uncharacterized protein n=1 Tax=Aquarana catesbeiana TaxID=8400 RepID=A0A2G9RU38_AQUCT|nr:hypothetical protein AB205_0176440 [Aquarana catesbeiana]
MLSLLPSRILRLLEFIGFSGNRELVKIILKKQRHLLNPTLRSSQMDL